MESYRKELRSMTNRELNIEYDRALLEHTAKPITRLDIDVLACVTREYNTRNKPCVKNIYSMLKTD